MTFRVPLITAVVVTFQSRDTIGTALDSLRESHDAGIADCIVVDNLSTDGTADYVAKDYPWVNLICSPTNLGYGRGCNLGFASVDTPYVMYMNPDATVSRVNLERLLGFAQSHRSAGLIAPAIHRAIGDYQTAGGLPTPWTVIQSAAGIGELSSRQIISPGAAAFQTDWVCGAMMVAPTSVIQKIGGFDPRFFLYFEETDLCLRIKMAGYEIWAVGEAVAAHTCNASARKTQPGLKDGGCLSEHYFKSRYYYLKKHYGVCAAASAECAELILTGLRDVARMVTLRGGNSRLRRRLQSPVLSLPDLVDEYNENSNLPDFRPRPSGRRHME